MKKVMVIAGTRPEAIKLAPVIVKLRKFPTTFETTVCASGQHDEMLHQAFEDFQIAPDLDLRVMRHGQSLAGVTARLFDGIDGALDAVKPDWILVQGDTTTAMVGALCGFYRRIKVGHVEAGLRSHNRWAPFPEEVNRRVVSIVGDTHFAPTEWAKGNLLQEGIEEENIVVTGNTVIDGLLWMVEQVRKNPPVLPSAIVEALKRGYRLVLITGHRRENFGPGLEEICLAIRDLAVRHRDTIFVYPVHLNPMVRKPVRRILDSVQRVMLIEPLRYKPFVWLMDRSALILSDSGGIQEEAPSLGKPVLVMRDVTERPEGVAAGACRLVGAHRDTIVEGVSSVLDDLDSMRSFESPCMIYGDGRAAQRIVEVLRG